MKKFKVNFKYWGLDRTYTVFSQSGSVLQKWIEVQLDHWKCNKKDAKVTVN